MRTVCFLNENTLGHSSYLPRFAEAIASESNGAWGVNRIDVAPLPEEREAAAQDKIRGAVRLGISTYYRKWREQASSHALELWRKNGSGDALVVNTQSVGLDLPGQLPDQLPMFVCLDATFRQLSSSPWFAPNTPSRLFQSLTRGDLLDREQRLFDRAQILLPWSESVAESLRNDYGIASAKIRLLPPSLHFPERLSSPRTKANGKPRLLFLGGDFSRKGGETLLGCYHRYFSQTAELDIVTQSPVEASPGVRVWRGVKANSEQWLQLWRDADVFVFPSRLETFGIVLLEAQSFGVPIVSSKAGAAQEILANGKAGWLLNQVDESSLAQALQEALDNPLLRESKAEYGYWRGKEKYDLRRNARALLSWIEELTA